jgi:hypothetical protein
MKLVTLVEKNVSEEESTHQMLNEDQTLLNEICNFGRQLCISVERKHQTEAQ